MRAAVLLRDVVREGEDRLVVAVVPLEGDVDADLDGAAADGRDAISTADDRTRDDRRARAVHMTHERSDAAVVRSEEHTSELQSLMRISYAVFCLKKKKTTKKN